VGIIDSLVIQPSFVYRGIMSLNDCLANYIKADRHFMDGIHRGVIACKEGRIRPWSEIKRELGIG